jgi:hypothetical protein
MSDFIYELGKNARAGGGRRECQGSRPCGSSLRRICAPVDLTFQAELRDFQVLAMVAQVWYWVYGR